MSDDLAQQEHMEKNVAYYETFLSAWVDSRMEKDKQILTLSALAIGLLVTFKDGLNDVVSFCVWLGASSSFVAAIVIILMIFTQNSEYIERLIREDLPAEKYAIERSLQRRTVWAFWLFVVGVTLTMLLAVYGAGFKIVKGV
ncbi:MAG: hypothetical protein HQL44_15310 [Alphaproteobacteria bacterium]|nr:hypothetical protein [Alphaproteobacteria bacterium]